MYNSCMNETMYNKHIHMHLYTTKNNHTKINWIILIHIIYYWIELLQPKFEHLNTQTQVFKSTSSTRQTVSLLHPLCPQRPNPEWGSEVFWDAQQTQRLTYPLLRSSGCVDAMPQMTDEYRDTAETINDEVLEGSALLLYIHICKLCFYIQMQHKYSR